MLTVSRRQTIRKTITAAILIVGIAAVILIYSIYDPMQSGWPLQCPSRLLTGLQCPGCGSQRALHALLHGDIAGCLKANLLLLPALVMMGLLTAVKIFPDRLPRLEHTLNHPLTGYCILAVTVLWGVVRNLI